MTSDRGPGQNPREYDIVKVCFEKDTKKVLTLELAEWFGQILSLMRSPNLCFILKAFKLVLAWLIYAMKRHSTQANKYCRIKIIYLLALVSTLELSSVSGEGRRQLLLSPWELGKTTCQVLSHHASTSSVINRKWNFIPLHQLS